MSAAAPPTVEPVFARYLAYIRDVACESPDTTPAPTPPTLYVPDAALVAFLIHIGNATPTRHGLDAALDILFSHPDIAPLLTSLTPHELADRVLPRTHPRFADFWTHIVAPAWEQHVALAEAIAASEAADHHRRGGRRRE